MLTLSLSHGSDINNITNSRSHWNILSFTFDWISLWYWVASKLDRLLSAGIVFPENLPLWREYTNRMGEIFCTEFKSQLRVDPIVPYICSLAYCTHQVAPPYFSSLPSIPSTFASIRAMMHLMKINDENRIQKNSETIYLRRNRWFATHRSQHFEYFPPRHGWRRTKKINKSLQIAEEKKKSIERNTIPRAIPHFNLFDELLIGTEGKWRLYWWSDYFP